MTVSPPKQACPPPPSPSPPSSSSIGDLNALDSPSLPQVSALRALHRREDDACTPPTSTLSSGFLASLGHPSCKARAREMLCQEPTPGFFICTFHKNALCSFSVTKGIASHSLTRQTLRGLESGLDCGVQRCSGLCSALDDLTEGVEELAAIGWQVQNGEGLWSQLRTLNEGSKN